MFENRTYRDIFFFFLKNKFMCKSKATYIGVFALKHCATFHNTNRQSLRCNIFKAKTINSIFQNMRWEFSRLQTKDGF